MQNNPQVGSASVALSHKAIDGSATRRACQVIVKSQVTAIDGSTTGRTCQGAGFANMLEQSLFEPHLCILVSAYLSHIEEFLAHPLHSAQHAHLCFDRPISVLTGPSMNAQIFSSSPWLLLAGAIHI